MKEAPSVTSDEEYVEFVRTHSSALLRTACLLTAGDRQAAEDLVQTALAQAFVAWWPATTSGPRRSTEGVGSGGAVAAAPGWVWASRR